MQDRLEVNHVEYKLIKLLGHGKGGYSYLAEKDGNYYVLKQIHHEPCDYYNFGNIKDFILAFIPLAIVSIPANIVNFTFNASYMFFRGGFPFSIISDHMAWWVWLIVLYCAYAIIPILFYLPSFIYKKYKKK